MVLATILLYFTEQSFRVHVTVAANSFHLAMLRWCFFQPPSPRLYFSTDTVQNSSESTVLSTSQVHKRIIAPVPQFVRKPRTGPLSIYEIFEVRTQYIQGDPGLICDSRTNTSILIKPPDRWSRTEFRCRQTNRMLVVIMTTVKTNRWIDKHFSIRLL